MLHKREPVVPSPYPITRPLSRGSPLNNSACVLFAFGFSSELDSRSHDARTLMTQTKYIFVCVSTLFIESFSRVFCIFCSLPFQFLKNAANCVQKNRKFVLLRLNGNSNSEWASSCAGSTGNSPILFTVRTVQCCMWQTVLSSVEVQLMKCK